MTDVFAKWPAAPLSKCSHLPEGLMWLLREVGAAYQQLCQYNCRRAVELLTALPSNHYHTGWVLAHIGKAYFEMNDYIHASRSVHLPAILLFMCFVFLKWKRGGQYEVIPNTGRRVNVAYKEVSAETGEDTQVKCEACAVFHSPVVTDYHQLQCIFSSSNWSITIGL